MADSDPKDLTAILSSRGQAPVIAMVLILATTMGLLNLTSRPGTNAPAPGAAAKAGATTTVTASGPSPRAGIADALDALEPLQRFLNLSTPPSSLDQLASSLA